MLVTGLDGRCDRDVQSLFCERPLLYSSRGRSGYDGGSSPTASYRSAFRSPGGLPRGPWRPLLRRDMYCDSELFPMKSFLPLSLGSQHPRPARAGRLCADAAPDRGAGQRRCTGHRPGASTEVMGITWISGSRRTTSAGCRHASATAGSSTTPTFLDGLSEGLSVPSRAVKDFTTVDAPPPPPACTHISPPIHEWIYT